MAKLFVCPTPIGNLEDLTLRTIRVLEEADIVAAEDTRHSLKLLNHLGLRKHLVSLHEHNENKKSEQILLWIEEGKQVALISDAGMPGISDPGEILIRKAVERGIKVEVLPGPVALVTALVGSGLSTGRFYFLGFLDRVSKNRKKELQKVQYFPDTLVLYESPHRIRETLCDMVQILGDRRIVLARELTKKYEEYIRTTLTQLQEDQRLQNIQGEMVLVVEGCNRVESQQEEVDMHRLLSELLIQGMSLKDASRTLADRYGMKKKEIYELGLHIKENEEVNIR